MRLVFVGSPPFAIPVLEQLLASPFRPVLVVTPPDRPRGRKRSELVRNELARVADEAGLDVVQPKTVRDEAFLERLRRSEPDVVLVAAYGEYLTREFREIAALETLNVHPSLLPRHRGASPVQATLLAGDERTGVSVQRVVREMDAGDVAVALETEVRPDETAGALMQRLAELGGEAAVRALERVAAGDTAFTPQDESRVTECGKLSVDRARLDWSQDARDVVNAVRAFHPWPVARAELPGGAELLVLRAHAVSLDDSDRGAPPGTLLSTGKRLVVRAGSGAVELTEVQPAGRKAMPAAAFLAGARLSVGERLGNAPSGASES